jgi:hypothetical protein
MAARKPMTGQAFFVLSALAEEAELRAATARVVRLRLGLSGAEAAARAAASGSV